MAWTSPRTWTAGERVTVALLNAEIQANLDEIARAGMARMATWYSAWTSTGTQPAIGNGTLDTGTWSQVGRLVVCSGVVFVAGSTTTYGTGTYSWGLPVVAKAANRYGGQVHMFDAGTTEWNGIIKIVTTTTFQVGTGGTTQTYAGQTSPWTWASGDKLRDMILMYEAAS